MYRSIKTLGSYLLLSLANTRFFLGDILHLEISKTLTVSVLILSLVLVDYSYSNLKFYGILFLSLVSSITLGGPNLAIIILFLAASSISNLSISKIVTVSLLLQIMFIWIMFLMISVGELDNHITILNKGVTMDLGFGNSNSLSMFLASITYTFIIWSRGKFDLKIRTCAFMSLIFINYYITIGRTILVGEFFCLITLLCMHTRYKLILKKIRKIIGLLPILFLIVIISFIVNLDRLGLLNELTTGRIKLWFNHFGYFISEGNIIVGYNYEKVYNDPLDCSYLTLLINCGIVWFAFYSYYIYKSITCNYKFINNYMPFIIGILISGFTENVLLPLSPINLIFITILFKSLYVERKQSPRNRYYVCSPSI